MAKDTELSFSNTRLCTMAHKGDITLRKGTVAGLDSCTDLSETFTMFAHSINDAPIIIGYHTKYFLSRSEAFQEALAPVAEKVEIFEINTKKNERFRPSMDLRKAAELVTGKGKTVMVGFKNYFMICSLENYDNKIKQRIQKRVQKALTDEHLHFIK